MNEKTCRIIFNIKDLRKNFPSERRKELGLKDTGKDGITLEEVGKLVGSEKQLIKLWENGAMPQKKNIPKLEKIFDMHVKDMIVYERTEKRGDGLSLHYIDYGKGLNII